MYKAHEMRNAATAVEQSWKTNGHLGSDAAAKDLIVAMLRYAADAEEELQTMRCTWLTPETSKALFNDCVWKTKEIDELKARLKAVVKECENLIPWLIAEKKNHECYPSGVRCGTLYLTKIKTILRAARGEEAGKARCAMASKVYTAQEMREMADCINNIKQNEMPSWKEGEIITGGDLCRSAKMLLQSAEMLERCEKKRKELDEEWFFEGADNLTMPMEDCYEIIDYILRGDAVKEEK